MHEMGYFDYEREEAADKSLQERVRAKPTEARRDRRQSFQVQTRLRYWETQGAYAVRLSDLPSAQFTHPQGQMREPTNV